MPVTKSAQKALRQNTRKRKVNNIHKKRTKELIKKVRALVAEKKTDEAKKLLSQIYKNLDKSAKKNVIKKNNASRKKGRITKLLNKNQ